MSLFRPAKSKKLAKIVSIRSPSEAKKSAKKLLSLFRKAERRDTKVKIKRATICASNRAKVLSQSRRLSEKERREMKTVSNIYKRAYQRMRL